MTLGEQLKQEGRQEEKLEIVKTLLAENADLHFIAKITKCSITQIEELAKYQKDIQTD